MGIGGHTIPAPEAVRAALELLCGERSITRPRHASDAAFPQKPKNGRFLPQIRSMSTSKDLFDAELDALFNVYTPIAGPAAAGLALEFVLPNPVGIDINNVPTNSWTVILSPVGSGVFQVWTSYPGHPVPWE